LPSVLDEAMEQNLAIGQLEGAEIQLGIDRLNRIEFKSGDTLIVWTPEHYPAAAYHELITGLKRFRNEMYEMEGITLHFLILPENLRISVLANEGNPVRNFLKEKGRNIELELEEKSE